MTNLDKLSLRKHFAGLAMQGLISGCYSDPEARPYICNPDEIKGQVSTCIDWADEMIRQLEEKDV